MPLIKFDVSFWNVSAWNGKKDKKKKEDYSLEKLWTISI